MGRTLALLLFVLVLSNAGRSIAWASAVTVPDDYATIQLALDSMADTVRVRAGNYPERPTFLRHERPEGVVVMEGLAENGLRPRMQGLIVDGPFGGFWVSGCAFTGAVDLNPGAGLSSVRFDSCDLDSGLTQHVEDTADYGSIAILRSRIKGPVVMSAHSSVCDADTFETYGVKTLNEASSSVRNCLFQGPGTHAVQLGPNDGTSHSAINNWIDGYGVGISGSNILVENNHIRNCQMGIGTELDATIRGNEIRDCETGINAYCEGTTSVANNTVLGSANDGIDVTIVETTGVTIVDNVVGRSGLYGMYVGLSGSSSSTSVTLERNTSYRNERAGFWIAAEFGSFSMTLRNNIAFENGTYGVDADTSTTPDGCNDWFGNVLGSTRGVTLSGTDLAVDPMFCDVDADSVHLSQKSPLLNAPGCGLIGARGLGCATTATLLSLFTAERDAEGVRLRWQVSATSSLELWIERAPAVAGPWSRIATERTTEGGVTTELDRDATAADDSWYRLVVREGGEVATLGAPLRVSAAAAGKFELVRIAPNPGPGPTSFRFTLAHEASVELDVFDLQGRHLASLVRGTLTAGVHVVKWSAPDLNAPGVRLVRYRYPGGQQVRRFVLAR